MIRIVAKNSTSLKLPEYPEEDIDNNNPARNCGTITTLFLPSIIDYSLEKTCEGCIEEEREMVERVMALKRAIQEQEEEEEAEDDRDSAGNGELVPVGLLFEGLACGMSVMKEKAEANDDVEGDKYDDDDDDGNGDATAEELRLAGARCRPGRDVSENEPSNLLLQMEKSVQVPAAAPVAECISALIFLPGNDVDGRRRQESVRVAISSRTLDGREHLKCKRFST